MTNITTASATKTELTTIIPTVKQQAPLATTTLSQDVQRLPLADSTHENRLQAALEHARRLTQMYGHQNADVAVSWETVEELKIAQRERLLASEPSCQALFERYCAENPHALECRTYDC